MIAFVPNVGRDDTRYKDESRRARHKNENRSILNFMYMGDKKVQFTCFISGMPGVTRRPSLIVEGEYIVNMGVEFNHIVQINTKSIHKTRPPSDYFRSTDFTKRKDILVEFMRTITLTPEEHAYITNNSKQIDIDLNTFKKVSQYIHGDEYTGIPWVLRNEENFNTFCEEYDLMDIVGSYEDFIGTLILNDK
jgi:hypothetical protein